MRIIYTLFDSTKLSVESFADIKNIKDIRVLEYSHEADHKILIELIVKAESLEKLFLRSDNLG